MRIKFEAQYRPDSFYNDPKMAGHFWAAETLDSIVLLLAKVAKTKKQRALAEALVDRSATSWHYFNNISAKEISQWSYVLRRIDKVQPLDLLKWLNNKPGCLKVHLHHILEALSYKHQQSAYMEHYVSVFKCLGMDAEMATERFHKYHKRIAEKFVGSPLFV